MAPRALAHRLAALAALLALLAPMWLGPAAAPLARALGGEPTHACSCGMAPGKCGCPECAAEGGPHAYATCKSSCDGDAALRPPDALMTCVLPAPHARHEPAPSAVASVSRALVLHSLEGEGPPTPPPRSTRS
jgi:hypothetical protein